MTHSDIVTKKRSRSSQSPEPTAKSSPAKVKAEEPEEDLEEEEEAPTKKRQRRTRKRVEDEEDEDEVIPDAKPTTPRKKAASTKGAAKKSPSATSSKRKRTAVVEEEDGDEEEAKGKAASESASEIEEDEDEVEDEKPAAAKKGREKAAAKLDIKAKDAYPDWKAGTPVPYAALCTTFSLIELTTKRLIITEYCALFLRQVLRLTPEDFLPTVLLMINKLAPDYAGIELGIGESLIMKSIGETTGRSLQVIKADQKEIGDLGLVAVKSRSTQPTMFKPKPLTVRGVHKGLMEVATVSGNGAQGRKVDLIKKLLSSADAHSTGRVDIAKDKGGPSEAKYIVRFLEGKLRLGLAERTVLVAIAQAMISHEMEQKSKTPIASQFDEAENLLKSVYRYVTHDASPSPSRLLTYLVNYQAGMSLSRPWSKMVL